MILTLARDAAEYAERGTLVLLDGLGFLVVGAWAGQGAIMGDAFLIVDSIINFPAGAERIELARVVRRIGFFEVAWKFVRARLRELVEVLLYDVGGTRPDPKRDSFVREG